MLQTLSFHWTLDVAPNEAKRGHLLLSKAFRWKKHIVEVRTSVDTVPDVHRWNPGEATSKVENP